MGSRIRPRFSLAGESTPGPYVEEVLFRGLCCSESEFSARSTVLELFFGEEEEQLEIRKRDKKEMNSECERVFMSPGNLLPKDPR